MFHIHTKNRVYTGFIYNENNEKLDDALTINTERINGNHLVITGDDEAIIPCCEIIKVTEVKEKNQEEDFPF